MDDPLRAIVDVLEHVLDGALVVGPDGRVSYSNLDTQRIFARDRGLLLGLHVEQLLVPLPAGWPEPGAHTAQARRADGSLLPVRLYVTSVGDCTIVTLQDRASATPVPPMPDPVDDPSQMLWSIAAAVDAFLFAGELSESGWYLPVFHGPGIEKLLGAGVAYEDANRAYDTCVHPEDYPAYEALYELETREEGVPAELTYRLRGLDGRMRWVRERSVLRRLGTRTLLFGVVYDVTPEHAARVELERAQADRSVAVERFERVVELANDLIVACDRDGTLRFANPAAESVLGFPVTELVGSGWDLFCHPEDIGDALNEVRAAFGQPAPRPGTVRCRTRGGSTVHISWAGSYDAEEDLMFYVGRDVTAEVAARAEIERHSRTDALTDLFNRRHVVDSLHAELERARRDGHLPGVLMVDLDQFKSVNDVYGHAAGDAVLRAVARRLGGAVRRYDIVGRWGGEEFCVVVPGISSEQALRRVADTVRATIAGAPVEIPDGRLLRVTASVGGALACDGLWSVEAIVDAADRALYAAKRAGRDRSLLVTELTPEQIAAEEPEAIRLAQALAVSASAREGLPESHVREVATLAGLIAAELGLTEDAVMRCRLGGWLHDLGKVAIPDRVLVKPGLLNEEEWEVMRTHSEIGERIVNRIAGLAQAAPIVRHHHERVDGTGYPDRLAGEEIPIEARIVAVADTYSALTTDRVYRVARSSEDAIALLRATCGAHHDHRCVEALVAVLAERAAYRRHTLVR